MSGGFWSNELVVGFVSGLLTSAMVGVAVRIWRSVRRDLGERPLARLKGRRTVERTSRIDSVQPWSEISLDMRCRVALGCVYLVLLDQYRESGEVSYYHRPRDAWGWGDSQHRVFGEPLRDERSPSRQASPGLTALALDVLGSIWPIDCRELPPFLHMGARYLTNHQAENGGINWYPTRGAGLDRVQVTGSLRHAASGSIALHRLACADGDLAERAVRAIRFVRGRWQAEGLECWKDTPEDFRPLTAGAIRRAVWYCARTRAHPESQWANEFIGLGGDIALTRAVWEMVRDDAGESWRTRASWDHIAAPEAYPARPVGPDNLPDSTLAFLVWSPIRDPNCYALVERVVDAARVRRTDDGGVQLYGASRGELGSACSLASLMLSEELRATLGVGEWQERYGALSVELLDWAVEHFWDPAVQAPAGLTAWLWLLETLLYNQDVREVLASVDPFALDAEVSDLRGGEPKLYHETPAELLAEIERRARTVLAERT